MKDDKMMPWSGGGGGSIHSRLQEFVKTCLIKMLVDPYSSVCDLYCGFGADTEKWSQAQIGQYIGIDLSASALSEARDQWEYHRRPYPAEFYELDPCGENLQLSVEEHIPRDIVCCMRNLQDCFASEEQARSLLSNVAFLLKPGGYFFGITADTSTLWSKYQKAVEGSVKAGNLRASGLARVRNDHYTIYFEDDRFTQFGTKYQIQFSDGLPSQTQLLVHFPSLIRLAREVGLENIDIQNTLDFYDEYRMSYAGILQSTCGNLLDKGRLSNRALDILSLFAVFVFKKSDYHPIRSIGSPSPTSDELASLQSSDMVAEQFSEFASVQNHNTANMEDFKDRFQEEYSHSLEATSISVADMQCPSIHDSNMSVENDNDNGDVTFLEKKSEFGGHVGSSPHEKLGTDDEEILEKMEICASSESEHAKQGSQPDLSSTGADFEEPCAEHTGDISSCKGSETHNEKKFSEVKFYSRAYHSQRKQSDGRILCHVNKSQDTEIMSDQLMGERDQQENNEQTYNGSKKLSEKKSDTIAEKEICPDSNYNMTSVFERSGKFEGDLGSQTERKILKSHQKDGANIMHDAKESERDLDLNRKGKVNNKEVGDGEAKIEDMPGILGPGPQELKFQQPIDVQYNKCVSILTERKLE